MRLNGRLEISSRIAFALEHSRVPEKCILHICDNRLCCNPDHLYEGTKSDNLIDAYTRDRVPGRLLEEDRTEAVRLHATGLYSHATIAKLYNVTPSAITYLVNTRIC